jgi:PAS domain S-box-containing protein
MDVTRAFETEEALEQSQRMLTLAYQVVGCGTWSYELDKEVAAWSPEMFELHGLPRAPHVMAGAILEGIHTEDRTEIVRQLSEVRERRRDEWNSEYRYLHPKRGMRWLQSIGRVQRKPSGARIFGITFDVTARKEVEERSREVVASHALSAALLRGQEEERSSIARELHDDVGQRLAFVSMELDRVSADSGAMRAALRPIRDHVVQISEDIRQLSHGLRSAILEDIGLAPAIRSECGRLASFLKGLTCRFRATGALTTLPQELQLCLFRNVQEAFHNISKHSRATAIKTILKRTSRQITLTVEDNGVGFEPKSAAGGIGFSIMRERLRPFRGTLTVNSKHGCGTKVEVVIPFAGSEKVAGGKSRTGRKSVS